MAYVWIADVDPATAASRGVDQSFRSRQFPTQADAEVWLTESYESLADEGIEAVTLMDDDRVVYGPMSLQP